MIRARLYIDSKGSNALDKIIRKLVLKLNNAIDELAELIAEEILENAKDNIDKMDINVTGVLKDSGCIVRVDKGVYDVVFEAPYAKYVEFGTRPHTPPYYAIRRWVVNKYKLSSKEADKLAIKVWYAIRRFGTKPKPFFRKAIDDTLFDFKNREEYKKFLIKIVFGGD